MAGIPSWLGIGLGAASGIGSALAQMQQQRDQQTKEQMQLLQGQGTFELTDMPGPNTFSLSGRHWKFTPYRMLGEQGAINLGLTSPVTSTIPASEDIGAFTPEYPAQPRTVTEQRAFPGMATLPQSPQFLQSLFSHLLAVNEARQKEARQRADDEAFYARRQQAAGIAPAEPTGIPPASQIPSPSSGGPTPSRDLPGLPTSELEGGQPGTAAVVMDPTTGLVKQVVGLPPDKNAQVVRVHQQFIEEGRPVSPQELPAVLRKSGVPESILPTVTTIFQSTELEALQKSIAVKTQQMAQNEADLFRPDVTRNPGRQRAIASDNRLLQTQITAMQRRADKLETKAEKAQDTAARPEQRGKEAAAIKEATAGAPKQLEAMLQLIREQQLPKGVSYPQLNDTQKAAVDDRAREIEDQAALRKQTLRTRAALQVAEGKFEQNKRAGEVALRQLDQLVDSVFTQAAPVEQPLAMAKSFFQRAYDKSKLMAKRGAQSTGQGVDIATYEDTATAHIITVAKGLTGTGRIAWQEIQQVLKGLPRINTGLLGGFLPDTKDVAREKMRRIRGLFEKASKTPAGTFAPYDVDTQRDPQTGQVVPRYLPLGGQSGPEPFSPTESSVSGGGVTPPPSLKEDLKRDHQLAPSQ